MWHILRWIEEDIGGVEAMEKINWQKSSALYDFIDATPLFNCPVEVESRSRMNVVLHCQRKAQKNSSFGKRLHLDLFVWQDIVLGEDVVLVFIMLLL